MENINEIIKKTIENHPKELSDFKNGKVGLLGLFVGEVMKTTKGQLDPKEINALVMNALKSS